MATKNDLIVPKRLNETSFQNITIAIQFYEKREKLTLAAKEAAKALDLDLFSTPPTNIDLNKNDGGLGKGSNMAAGKGSLGGGGMSMGGGGGATSMGGGGASSMGGGGGGPGGGSGPRGKGRRIL